MLYRLKTHAFAQALASHGRRKKFYCRAAYLRMDVDDVLHRLDIKLEAKLRKEVLSREQGKGCNARRMLTLVYQYLV